MIIKLIKRKKRHAGELLGLSKKIMNAGKRLRQLLLTGKCLQLPGAFNGLSARLAADFGFKAVYLSGGAISAASGVPDIGLCSMDYFTSRIREVSCASGLPVLADADTGFGEVEMVAKTVAEYIHAGAGGFHIEDQIFPKRCGHLDGKVLVPVQDMVNKLQRAKEAAGSSGFLICARTDARSVEGLDSAIQRAKLYVEAGVDMIFPEGLMTLEEFKNFSNEMQKLGSLGLSKDGGPFLMANMTEFGKTDHIHISDFEKSGYHCVIYPVSSLRVAMKAIESMYEVLRDQGSLQQHEHHMMTRDRLYEVLKYQPGKEWHYPNPSSQSRDEETL